MIGLEQGRDLIRIYAEHWPFVIAVVHGEVTDDDFEYMYDAYRDLHKRGQRFYLAQETRGAIVPSARVRKQLADLNTDFATDIEQHVIGVGITVGNTVVAGALRAIFWISRERTPTHSTSRAIDTFEHAVAVCEKENAFLPPSARSFSAQLDATFDEGKTLEEYAQRPVGSVRGTRRMPRK